MLAAVFVCGWYLPCASGKEPSLSAIELFDGASGAAYVQLSEVQVNGKAELRQCAQAPGLKVDKSAYGKLPRVVLAPGGELGRGEDGVLTYKAASGVGVCVVPNNVKFEHNAVFSLSELADQAVIKGNQVGRSSDGSAGVTSLKKGERLLFVAAPDVDLAEFLRAERAGDVPGWRAYLEQHPESSHAADGKAALAALYLAAGQRSLEAYQGSIQRAGSQLPVTGQEPSYRDLKDAKTDAELAGRLIPAQDGAKKLSDEVFGQLGAVVALGRAELDQYHAALTAHGPGFVHLANAKKLGDAVASVDGQLLPGAVLRRDVQKDFATYESVLQSATTAMGNKEVGKATTFIEPYRAFAGEDPRMGGIVDALYAFHVDQGAQAGGKLDWALSIAEFKKAQAVKDTPDVQANLKSAMEQAVVAQNQSAAKIALAKSKSFEDEHDAIHAYEVLANLNAAERVLVKADMERLAPAYVQSAAMEAKNLSKMHAPIKSINDADALETAYAYLKSAYELSENDESYLVTMGALGDELSGYYLTQATHYLDKPEGSGTELGWTYLQEALSFKAPNQEKVIDARTGAAAAHAMHSRVSIQVQFRDGTSQRDSQGFATELENDIIRGLETSAVSVKAIRYGESTAVKPDYQLVGDVLQHHVSDTPTLEAMNSKYFYGENEVANDAWNKANRDYESAVMELSSAQQKLQGAEAKGNKKTIEELTRDTEVLRGKVSAAHLQMDSIPKSKKTRIDQPYTYTKKTIDYKGTISLQFRIQETLSGQGMQSVPLAKENHKQVVVLEGVKADDSEGVKPSGAPLDKAEEMAALESQARDELIEKVRAQVEALPKSIYLTAKRREAEGDGDGAAEAYLRYLKSTREDESVERKHAMEYLHDQFHLRADASLAQ